MLVSGTYKSRNEGRIFREIWDNDKRAADLMEQKLARQVATPLDDSGGSHLNFQILNVNV